ncbi:MAG: hypothetical protein WC782_16370 [Methylococcaceae bacterium]
MSCNLSEQPTTVAFHYPQPNEMDHKRIVRGIEDRKRYRYVTPQVKTTANGYLITSPCCSRNIDPAGGEIDIALLEYSHSERNWHLFRKDHGQGQWVLHADYVSLPPILALLREDPERSFWQ